MVSEIGTESGTCSNPHIHVWMSVEEAARAHASSTSVITRRAESGEIESRLRTDGACEVLVELPSRNRVNSLLAPSPENSVADFAPDNVETALSSLMKDLEPDASQDARPARRTLRFAWAAGVVALLVLAAGVTLTATAQAKSRALSARLSDELQATQTARLERDMIRRQLDAAQSALEKSEGELLVERNVEDTLFKAVRAAHAARERSMLAGAE